MNKYMRVAFLATMLMIAADAIAVDNASVSGSSANAQNGTSQNTNANTVGAGAQSSSVGSVATANPSLSTNPVAAIVTTDNSIHPATIIPKAGATNAQGSIPNGVVMSMFTNPNLVPEGVDMAWYMEDVCGSEVRTQSIDLEPVELAGGVTASFVPMSGYHGNNDGNTASGQLKNVNTFPFADKFICVGIVNFYPTDDSKGISPAGMFNAAKNFFSSDVLRGHSDLYGMYGRGSMVFLTGNGSDVSTLGLSTSASGVPGTTFVNGTIGYSNTVGEMMPRIATRFSVAILQKTSTGKQLKPFALYLQENTLPQSIDTSTNHAGRQAVAAGQIK